MKAEPKRSWVRVMAACPHCGRTVMFDGEGRCPSCRIPGDAPVTAADAARIAGDAANQAARRERPTTDGGAGDFLTGALAGTFLGILALAYALGTPRSPSFRLGVTVGLCVQLALLTVRFLLTTIAAST